uniref:Conserved oligomeric Golgi complex subunit 6 n=1 Tax=Panagrellus redivivus TaxID=6233 RepID=A0A7E4VW48_PANRE
MADTGHFSLKSEIDSLINSQIQNDETFAANLQYLQNIVPASVTDEKAIEADSNDENAPTRRLLLRPIGMDREVREIIDNRELELFDGFADQFSKMNDQVQTFVNKIQSMNDICNDLSNRIQSNKEKTRDLLRKTSILQTEKKQLQAKEAYLNDFFEKYAIPAEDEKALLPSNDGVVSESFFKAIRKLVQVIENVNEACKVSPDNIALTEIAATLEAKKNEAYNVLFASIQRECRLLNVEFLELKPVLYQSFEVLQSRDDLFTAAIDEYSNARRGFVVHAFIDALTKGSRTEQQRPIEQVSSETLRYANDMLAWMHQELEVERELLTTLLKNCHPETVNSLAKRVLSTVSEGLCQPLKMRVEQSLTRESNCVVLYRLSSLFLYYEKTFENVFGPTALLVKCLHELHELASNMFFSNVTATVHRILGNMTVPDYDLLPVTSINQTLLLLRDILESQNDGAFAAVIDKKDMYTRIFSHILDPLNQSIQLISSNLHSHLDIAVYMLNCLSAIKSVIILYQYTDNKLEMIKAQIDANEDVLVSEQASAILTNTGLLEIYRKALAHQPNQGPMAKLPGMEPERIAGAIALFNGFLDKPEGFQCHQCAKISSARSRESVQVRTFDNVVAAYSVIYAKVTDSTNGYPSETSLKPIDDVKAVLAKNVY